MRKRALFALFATTILLSLTLTSAELSIQEPNEIYNLGDKLYLTVNGIIGTNAGNLNIDLHCGENSQNLIRWPARSFSPETESSFSEYKFLTEEDLEIEDLNNLIGSCSISASLGNQDTTTEKFTISNDINIQAELDTTSYDPGQPIQITITATKASGEPLQGFVQGIGAAEFTKAIETGTVTETFSLATTAEAGKYALELIAYDQGEEGKRNQGTETIEFLINQIPTSLIPSMSESEITPGATLKIGSEVFDQSGQKIETGTIAITIISPTGEEIQKIMELGNFAEFEFPTNALAGIWKLQAFYEGLGQEIEFSVLSHKQVNYNIEDSILTVTNIGNDIYDKPISIQIGEETKELELNINVGESRKFNLKAPQGEYEVTVGDEENSISRQVLLTGNAISVKNIREANIFKAYTPVWIFLIIVLAGVGIFFLLKAKKTNTLGASLRTEENKIIIAIKAFLNKFKRKVDKNIPTTVKKNMNDSMHFTNKSPAAHSLDPKQQKKEDKTLVDLTKKKGQHAESALVLKGEKYPSAVICIAIKNYKELNENSIKELHNITNLSKKNKGLVDWRGEYIFIVYAPLITKTYHNENLAVKTGYEIIQALRAHNKKFNNKIEYNIGIHTGELLASKAGRKLKYTSIGNTIALAKRIGDSDREKLLVSDNIRKKMLRDMKTHRHKQIGEHNIFQVEELKNKAANEAKLKELLKRTKNTTPTKKIPTKTTTTNTKTTGTTTNTNNNQTGTTPTKK